MKSKKFNYVDVTQILLKNAKPNNDIIPEIFKYKKYDLKNTIFDSKDIKNIDRFIDQIIDCLNKPEYSWINIVILYGNDDLIKIFKKKK